MLEILRYSLRMTQNKMKLSFEDIAAATGAKILQKGPAKDALNVCIDSRLIKKGDFFIAIKGPHFDGHDFIDEVIEKGACAVIRSKKQEAGSRKEGVWVLEVADTVKALGDIAAAWRRKNDIKVVAVTGSNGKSTTKEMIAAGLSTLRRVIKTEGNFNNLIGLPLQVLRDIENYDVALFEMGMNAPGEIRRLAEIASPDIGVITNVNPAHLEKLHTVENVAKAKGELFEAMRPDGIIIVNAEDPWVMKLASGYKGKKTTFGMQNGCDVQFGRLISEGLDRTDLTFYIKGREFSMRLPVPGVHNVMNAMAAIAVGVALGVSPLIMVPDLERFSNMKMRMERIQLLNGVQVINDCYNANPSSMQAALRTLSVAKRAGRFIAVLGDMLELGEAAPSKHVELGEGVATFGVNKLFIAGDFAADVAKGAKAKGMNDSDIKIENDLEVLKDDVTREIKTGDVVLVKGSRGMKMERVVEHLKSEIGV
ncbi:MAG: hypothetical protein COV46_03270 [Deltaproteobacteria bacterium CG11_big_fil_rev_8_21_14_0_20_49_13]|nr:MAG: hypothetical protein COV46_03270 [Deltaproteobacteria bacterium CG11_big_fil_rev_8_21_14_0_20_49_13]